jgi:hypothetical protein
MMSCRTQRPAWCLPQWPVWWVQLWPFMSYN